MRRSADLPRCSVPADSQSDRKCRRNFDRSGAMLNWARPLPNDLHNLGTDSRFIQIDKLGRRSPSAIVVVKSVSIHEAAPSTMPHAWSFAVLLAPSVQDVRRPALLLKRFDRHKSRTCSVIQSFISAIVYPKLPRPAGSQAGKALCGRHPTQKCPAAPAPRARCVKGQSTSFC